MAILNLIGTGIGTSRATINSSPVVNLPGVSLLTATGITDTTATVGATLDCKGLETTWSIEYGTTTAYGNTQAGGVTSVNVSVSVDINSLIEGTTYHWRVKATNSEGTAYSQDHEFTTLNYATINTDNLASATYLITEDDFYLSEQDNNYNLIISED